MRHNAPCGVFIAWVGKFTLRASEGKFGAFVTEFENGWIQWNSGRVEGKMGRENILQVKVG